MDALIEAAKQRERPRDLAIFLILRYTGMRRESVATLRVRHLDSLCGLRNVRVKGGKTRDIPLPQVVTQFLQTYVEQHLPTLTESITSDTPPFWSTWSLRRETMQTYTQIRPAQLKRAAEFHEGKALDILSS